MQSQSSVRVLIANNQPVLREGLHGVLTQQSDLQPVGVATSGAEVLALCQRLRPDVVVMDDSLPVPLIVTRLQNSGLPCKVVMLLEPVEEHRLLAVVKSGVDGVVPLTEPPETVMEAIRTVAQGSKYLPERLLEH